MLRFDLAEFEQAARRLGGAIDQVPFAISQTLNDAAFAARASLIENTWPSHVAVRNRNFPAMPSRSIGQASDPSSSL